MVGAESQVQEYALNTKKRGGVVIVLLQTMTSIYQINDGYQYCLTVDLMYHLHPKCHNVTEVVIQGNNKGGRGGGGVMIYVNRYNATTDLTGGLWKF